MYNINEKLSKGINEVRAYLGIRPQLDGRLNILATIVKVDLDELINHIEFALEYFSELPNTHTERLSSILDDLKEYKRKEKTSQVIVQLDGAPDKIDSSYYDIDLDFSRKLIEVNDIIDMENIIYSNVLESLGNFYPDEEAPEEVWQTNSSSVLLIDLIGVIDMIQEGLEEDADELSEEQIDTLDDFVDYIHNYQSKTHKPSVIVRFSETA